MPEHASQAKSSEEGYCCRHTLDCSVHQLPFDNGYVACTCAVGISSLRHERVRNTLDKSRSVTVQHLAHNAQGALIALESGDSALAARLLTDMLGLAAESDARHATDDASVDRASPTQPGGST